MNEAIEFCEDPAAEHWVCSRQTCLPWPSQARKGEECFGFDSEMGLGIRQVPLLSLIRTRVLLDRESTMT